MAAATKVNFAVLLLDQASNASERFPRKRLGDLTRKPGLHWE